MDQASGGEGALVTGAGNIERTPEQVRAEIEQTRAQLGQTVEALAAKTDVKGQARHALHGARASVNQRVTAVTHSVSDSAHGMSTAVQRSAPPSASEVGARAGRLARENRLAVVAAGALALGILIGRRR